MYKGRVIMLITSISFSYFFLILSMTSLIFFVYYKVILIKSNGNSDSSKKIIGNMKNPKKWRGNNEVNSYISLFFTILSLSIFIYLKFFMAPKLISILFLFAYICIIAISVSWSSIRKKAKY